MSIIKKFTRQSFLSRKFRRVTKISLVAMLALALVLGSGAGAAQAALTFDATSVTGSTTASLVSNTSNAVSVDSGTIGAVNIGTGNSAKIITVGNAASTEAEINALLVDINAGATGMTIDFGAGNLAITGGGASADFTLDADLISIDGTGTSNITVTGAAGEDFTIAQAGAADASLFLSSTGTGADALTIIVSGASGDIQVDATAGTVIVDGGEAVADALLLRATGGTLATAHLTSNGTGTAAVDIDATGTGGDIDIDAVDAIDILAGGVFSIDGTGASNVSATSGNLTLSTITTGVLILSSAGNTTLDVAAGGLLSVDVAAPGLEVAAASNISVAASDSTGVVAQTLTIELTGAADDEDDFTVRATGAEGDLLLTSGDDLLIDTVGLLELNSSAGVISIGNDAVNQNIGIGTAGTRTITVGSATTILNATAADASYINLGAVLHNDAAAQGLKLPNALGTPTAITANPEGFIAWDATNNLLFVSTDAGWASSFNNTASANTWTDNQIYTFAGDEDIAITNTTATTVDPLSVTVTSTGAADAASISLTINDTAAANVVDTIAGLNIAVTSAATGEADVLAGLNIANLASADGTVLERAIVVGTGWDQDLRFADTSVQIVIADAGTFTFENATGADFLTLTATAGVLAGDLTITGGDLTVSGEASTITIIDNTANALVIESVTDGLDYLAITTTNDAETMVLGHSTVDSITLATDGAGTAEVALPAGSIDSTEILDATIASADIAQGVIQYAVVEVSSAEILALFTTPKELVAAPGANKSIEFISAFIAYDKGATTYTINGSGDMQVKYTNGSGAAASSTRATTGFIDQAGDQVSQLEKVGGTVVPVVNAAIVLALATANPTLGDGTLHIKVAYRVHATGL